MKDTKPTSKFRWPHWVLGIGIIIYLSLSVLHFSMSVLLFAKDKYQLLAHTGQAQVRQPNVLWPWLWRMEPLYKENIGRTPDGNEVILQSNEQGFSSHKNFVETKQPNVIRIAVLAGSAGITGSTNQHTFSALLEQYLNEAGSEQFEVYNFAVSGFGSTQELMLLETEVLHYQPDIVIIYDGANDAYFASFPDFEAHWNPYVPVLVSHFNRYFRPFVVLRRELKERINWFNQSSSYKSHSDTLRQMYFDNLFSMTAIVQAMGANMIVIHQPTLIWSSDKPLAPIEQALYDQLNPDWIAVMQTNKLSVNTAVGELASIFDFYYEDFADVFDGQPEPIYADWVHPMNRGNELIATRLVTVVQKVLETEK